jgi:RNA polymerase sigma-70 factor (ECF subfamily)
MIEHDDRELIIRCRKGERRAYGELVERYEKVVYNVAYRLLGNRNDAEDVSQTVFLRIAERLDDYNPKFKFFSWMYRIAVNESLNRRRGNRPVEHLEESLVAGGTATDEAYIQHETTAGLQDAIMKLKEEYRSVVVLRHFEDLSYTEIAGVLQIPEKTVKSRLFSARQQLKSLLWHTVK